MQISEKGLAFIVSWESFKSDAYPDPATGGDPWTIGYGTTRYPDGSKVKPADVCTKEQAMNWKMSHIKKDAKVLAELNVNQNQYDAIASFVYNTGAWKTTTLRKKVLANPSDPSIRDEFMKWNKARVNGKLKVIKGLTNRRKGESDLYFS